jgi:hypothetical protein
MTRTYTYKGWTYGQQTKGHWILTRLSDGYTSWHQSSQGCRSFIRLYGTAADPDLSLELSYNTAAA